MKDLSSFYFPGKEPDEKIVLLLRRHPVVVAKRLLFMLLAGLIPIAIHIWVSNNTSWLSDHSSIFYLALVLFGSLVYLFWLLFIYQIWVNYYLDVWVVTNERIIAMEQVSIFHRDVSELRLDSIQDVSSDVHGIFASLFRYGDILVQTASEKDKFHFEQVPNPEIIARTILELRKDHTGKNPLSASQPQPAPVNDQGDTNES